MFRGVITTLPQALPFVGIPGTALLDDAAPSAARSRMSPSLEMPTPKRMSNSVSRKGGATLFLTTFTFVRMPTTSCPSLMDVTFRMSSRWEA